MKFTGEGYINPIWAAGLTQDQFVKEMQGPGYAHLFKVAKRNERLKEVHRLCKQKAGKPVDEVTADPEQ